MINRITEACLGAGGYTLSVDSMNPAVVLERLLDAVAVLDPRAHRELLAPGGAYASIPVETLHDALHPWWETSAAMRCIEGIVMALNAAAPVGFRVVYSEGDRFELARWDEPKQRREAALPLPSLLPRHSSRVRCRVLAPEP